MILEGEVKDAKMSSFSSDFQTLIKHYYNFLCIFLWIIHEFENERRHLVTWYKYLRLPLAVNVSLN